MNTVQGEARSHLSCSPGLADRDTYSRARGSLSSSFSIFASRTLWGEGDKFSVVRWQQQVGTGPLRHSRAH